MPGNGIALQILGTGEYTPRRRILSTELDRRWGKAEGWTARHTGVESRGYADVDENIIVMGASAARQACAAAQIDANLIDAIIAVGSVPYQAIPCTAVFIQRELGLGRSGIAAFDINSTCLGFLVAIDLVSNAIATGRYSNVLIVASERASQGLNDDDSSTAGLFGDGAGRRSDWRCPSSRGKIAICLRSIVRRRFRMLPNPRGRFTLTAPCINDGVFGSYLLRDERTPNLQNGGRAIAGLSRVAMGTLSLERGGNRCVGASPRQRPCDRPLAGVTRIASRSLCRDANDPWQPSRRVIAGGFTPRNHAATYQARSTHRVDRDGRGPFDWWCSAGLLRCAFSLPALADSSAHMLLGISR